MNYRHVFFMNWELNNIFKPLLYIRTPWLDQFFFICSYPDTQGKIFIPLYFILVWLLWSERWGARLFYLLMTTMISWRILKYVCWMARPCQLSPAVGVICTTHPGMPSGAAMISIVVPGFFIYAYPRAWAWVVGVTCGVLLALSRIYLGMHFVSDVLAGWLVGALLLCAFIKLHRPIERWLSTSNWQHALVALWSVAALYGLISWRQGFDLMPTMGGIGLGIALSKRDDVWLPDPNSWRERLMRVGLFLIGCGLFFALMLIPLHYCGVSRLVLRYVGVFSVGLWLSYGIARVERCIRGRRVG